MQRSIFRSASKRWLSHRFLGPAVVLTIALPLAPEEGRADHVTQCTALDLCYCVNTDYRDAIAANVVRVRELMARNKAEGKAIGYLSIPLSAAGGGSFAINSDIAGKTAEKVTTRFGAKATWILNPGAQGGDRMNGASGADYMYMWTQILEGRAGLGEDFDFFYFVGPSDFARYFELTGEGDLVRLESWFDDRLAKDANFKQAVEQGKLSKAGFRNYYGLCASTAFSYGSHDEWNIARTINERRRGATDYGIANELPIFFDGRAVTPGGYETPAAAGDAGRCIN